ncbi:MAG: hypothetical protein A3H43_01185 [Gammaproteobacteria bacterium RIFCSPLOWO2_02_FULL_42_9]|nr:MAG: hypothetical protein A3H43_01185 [Gammaproteobacteria bacterium RIFCSPLOWO2_02_FULL_42_9]
MKRIMQNFYVKFLLIFSVLFYCPFVFADTDVNVKFFTAPATDISLQFVSALFGRFTDALPQVVKSTSILSTMFTSFNHAVLVLGAIIILYTTMLAIINTAHQGEFLGKKFDSMWVPIRSVAGFALLIPVVQGYSSIQIFMMWVITQGVGAADSLWNAVVPAFDLGSSGSGTSIQHTDTLEDAMKIEDVWKGIFCMYQQYQTAHGGALPEQPLIPYVFDIASPNPTLQELFGNGKMSAYTYEDQHAYTYAFIPMTDWGDTQNYTCGSLLVPSGTWTTTPTDGINQQIPILMAQMQTAVNSLNNITYNYLVHGVQPGTNPLVDLAYQLEGALSNISNSSDLTGWKEKAETQGWMSAGQFYFKIVASSGGGNTYKTFDNSLKFWSGETYKQVDNGPSVSDPLLTSFDSDANNQLGSGSVVPSASTYSAADKSFKATGVWSAIVNILAPNFKNLYASEDSINPIYLTHDPLITIHEVGDNIITSTVRLWGVSLVAALVAAAFGVMSGVSSVALVIQTATTWLLLPLLALFGAVFGFGITMAVYIPLIPFIIFLFAAIGWLFAVVETMLAAPLVALGITHPEGHEVYGRAEPAVQLLVNVFLRPSFILFGFVCGILLMRISLTYLNLLFGGAMSYILSDGSNAAKLFKYLMVFAVYITLVIGIVNRCFALTHIIPDQVLRWISNQTQFGTTSPDQSIEGGIKGAAGSLGSSGHGGGGGGHGKPHGKEPKVGGGGADGIAPAAGQGHAAPPAAPAGGGPAHGGGAGGGPAPHGGG